MQRRIKTKSCVDTQIYEQPVVVVVVVVLTLTRIIKSVVTGQAPVTLELRKTPGKTHTQLMAS